ncbi:hypothetical protein AB0469_14500 [Streptomyces sp. NPDC093801]|uniref:hypothetical protein n=1 Tax=Streptomyces sp. NPDC093801 TaxID=3155203 RepID=UPI00344CB5CF
MFGRYDFGGDRAVDWVDFERPAAGTARECGRDIASPQVEVLLSAYGEAWEKLRWLDLAHEGGVTLAQWREGLADRPVRERIEDVFGSAADAEFTLADLDQDHELSVDELLDLLSGAALHPLDAVEMARRCSAADSGITRRVYREARLRLDAL